MEQQEGVIADGEPASSNPVNNKPNKWLATALAFLYPPIGMLIVAQPVWAVGYFIVGANLVQFFSHDDHMTWGVGLAHPQ